MGPKTGGGVAGMVATIDGITRMSQGLKFTTNELIGFSVARKS